MYKHNKIISCIAINWLPAGIVKAGQQSVWGTEHIYGQHQQNIFVTQLVRDLKIYKVDKMTFSQKTLFSCLLELISSIAPRSSCDQNISEAFFATVKIIVRASAL